MSNREKYQALFRQEATKLVGRISGALLDLEEDLEQLGPLRQDLHTLKGSARLVNLDAVGALAHALEDFSAPGTPCAQGDADAIDLALEALDALEGLAGLGKPRPSEEELADLLRRLHPEEGGGDEEPAPASPPARAPAPAGPDLVEAATPGPLSASAQVDAPREPLAVPIEELDRLLNLSGELLLQHHRMVARFDQGRQILGLIDKLRGAHEESSLPAEALEEVGEQVDELTRSLEGDMVDAGFLFSEVRERTAGVRMQPFSSLVEPIQRQVRGDARRLGKKVELKVRGGNLPMDRGILEYLRPVLLHTITNSLAHGIEVPEQRLARGKPETGSIRVAAEIDGNRIRILVEDDGVGLDPGILRQAAVRKGLLDQAAAAEMEDEEALHLIFQPGFSTARVVSNVAGRGVGMDAVRASVERLRGQITIESERSRYTRIQLLLPAAIGVIHGLVVRLGDELLGLPMSEVRATLFERTARSVPDRAPYLGELLGWGPAPDQEGARWWVVLKDGAEERPVQVDAVVRHQELVLKYPGRLLVGLPHMGGVTMFADGRVGVVLKLPDLLRELRLRDPRRPASSAPARPPVRPGTPVLVVDDSSVARTLIKEALEEVGYQVGEAADGAEALKWLEENPAEAVVTDYEMPYLDGMQLLEKVRAQEGPPVLLLTSRAVEIRQEAEQAGACGVFLKGPQAFPDVLARMAEVLADD